MHGMESLRLTWFVESYFTEPSRLSVSPSVRLLHVFLGRSRPGHPADKPALRAPECARASRMRHCESRARSCAAPRAALLVARCCGCGGHGESPAEDLRAPRLPPQGHPRAAAAHGVASRRKASAAGARLLLLDELWRRVVLVAHLIRHLRPVIEVRAVAP